MADISVGDKIYLGDRKGAFRVVGFTKLNGERAVKCADASGFSEFNKKWRKGPIPVRRVVPIADLIKEGKGWRERWRQQELDLGDRVATSMDTQ